MSSRNIRKIRGDITLPPPGDDSDGDYEPYAKNVQSTYEGLVITDSESDQAQNVEEDSEEGAAAAAPVPATSSKSAKKRRRRQAKALKARQHRDELDEIDRSVRAVNALLGTPPPAPPPPVKAKVNQGRLLMALQPKFLDVTNELRRMFGPEEPEDVIRTKTHIRMLKRVLVKPTRETELFTFKKAGLTMSISKRERGHIYFTFDHDADYQKIHRKFLSNYAHSKESALNGGSRDYMHVEALLEASDALFRVDDHNLGNRVVENVVTYLQYVAHPSFNLSSSDIRLEYKYIENRPFHVAMLRYLYLLSNKALHRTALEIAKMMINLDPNDPLAVLFVIDTIALRAREHKWLINACKYFNKQREAGMMFNIQFSNALAHYHVAIKENVDLDEADKFLQAAILGYPQVVVNILEYANVSNSFIDNHVLFKPELQTPTNVALAELIMLYTKMTWQRWREPGVMEWLLKNIEVVCNNYLNCRLVRENATALTVLRHSIFQTWPTEIQRHISVISSMANLLIETPLTEFNVSCGWNPLHERGVNRYNYPSPIEPHPASSTAELGSSALYRFFSSMSPNYNVDPPAEY